jgi:DNA-binding protein HU-beta
MTLLTQQDLIRRVANRAGLPQPDVANVLTALAVEFTQALADGQRVRLPGIGSLEAVERAERMGRNPTTGETITVPAKRAVKFRPSGELKVALAPRQDERRVPRFEQMAEGRRDAAL